MMDSMDSMDSTDPDDSCGFQVMEVWIPSGYVKIAIENGHRNSEFSH
jgi:hypothetical protein